MNWYKIAQSVNSLTKEQKYYIDFMYGRGLGQRGIAKELSISRDTVRSYLKRKKNIALGLYPNPKRNILSDQKRIDEVKKLRKTVNPSTGKLYNKSQIAEELGISKQTVYRIMSYHDPQSSKDMINYMSYEFWAKYPKGIKNTLANLKPKDRFNLMSNFIDELFENKSDRLEAKRIFFEKFRINPAYMDENDTYPQEIPSYPWNNPAPAAPAPAVPIPPQKILQKTPQVPKSRSSKPKKPLTYRQTYRQQVKKLWDWYDQQEALGERPIRDLEAEHRENLRLLREQRQQQEQISGKEIYPNNSML